MKNLILILFLLFAITKINAQGINESLENKLDSIQKDDQKYRRMQQDILQKYGADSAQLFWKTSHDEIHKIDSVSLTQVISILDLYGWLGPEVVGEDGNVTLFLVIQHADLKTQEKYLPMMREAVKNGKAYPRNLALLEDRVAKREGKKQIYGSQIEFNDSTKTYFVFPIEDEPNVNKRRTAVGLETLEEYVKQWNIKYILPIKQTEN